VTVAGGRLYDVKKPLCLCPPVDKNGEGILHPARGAPRAQRAPRAWQIG